MMVRGIVEHYFSRERNGDGVKYLMLDDWQKVLKRRVDGKSPLSEKPKENGIIRQLWSIST